VDVSKYALVKSLLQLGLFDQRIDHGDIQQLRMQCGLDGQGMVRAVIPRLGSDEPRLVANN
jgi:deoxyxylulose-5-phosphate synthase